MINGVPYDLETRVADLERQLTGLGRRSSEQRYGRDGRAVLSVRLGAETCALVRHAARERGCTIADLLRPAILGAVNAPSTAAPNTPSIPDRPQARMRETSSNLPWLPPRRLASQRSASPKPASTQKPGDGWMRDKIVPKST
jgi:hypothetical protein